jgi:hypothetical protein
MNKTLRKGSSKRYGKIPKSRKNVMRTARKEKEKEDHHSQASKSCNISSYQIIGWE